MMREDRSKKKKKKRDSFNKKWVGVEQVLSLPSQNTEETAQRVVLRVRVAGLKAQGLREQKLLGRKGNLDVK